MPKNQVVETALAEFKSSIGRISDRDVKEALTDVYDKLEETYQFRVEASDHAGSFGSVEADLKAAEKAVAGADAAMFKGEMYGKFSLQQLFDGWKATPVPDAVASIAKPTVRKKLVATKEAVESAYETLFAYFNQEADPSPRLANRLGALGKSLQARRDRLEERIRSLDALV